MTITLIAWVSPPSLDRLIVSNNSSHSQQFRLYSLYGLRTRLCNKIIWTTWMHSRSVYVPNVSFADEKRLEKLNVINKTLGSHFNTNVHCCTLEHYTFWMYCKHKFSIAFISAVWRAQIKIFGGLICVKPPPRWAILCIF